jgi:hypothetical protein
MDLTIGDSIIGATIIGDSIIGDSIIGATIVGATMVGDSITGDSITGDMETDGIMGFTDSIISIMADFLGNLLVITIITETTILTEKERLIIAEIIQLKEEFHQLLIEGIALFQVKLILLKEAPITILLEQEV